MKVASRGVRAFRSGQYAEAAQCFTEALDGKSQDLCKIRCNRAAAYLALGKNKKALKDANLCIEEKPTWAKAHGRKAAALFGMCKFDLSAAAYMESLTFDENSAASKAGLKRAREYRDRDLSKDENEKKLAAFFVELGTSTSNKKKDMPKKVRQVDDSIIINSTPLEQIERLTQQNSFWKNLNPYNVLLLPVEATDEDIKQRYHRLSVMVHPDKIEDPRARDAFIVVKNAHKTLNNKNKRENIVKRIDGARRTVEKKRKRLLKKYGKESTLPPLADAIANETMHVFVQSEQRRHLARKNQVSYTKRDREAENKARKKSDQERAYEEGWIERRMSRVNDWRGFLGEILTTYYHIFLYLHHMLCHPTGMGKRKKYKGMEIRAPEFKQEVLEGRKGTKRAKRWR